MIRGLKDITKSVVSLVWPETCAGCGDHVPTHEGFCEACGRRLLSLTAADYCPRCGGTLGPGLSVSDEGCYGCPDVAFRFAAVVRVGPYTHPIRHAIHGMKYRREGSAGGHLARLLALAVLARLADAGFDVVQPIPMHWARRIWRGRNHAGQIARVVARRLRTPLGDELVRVRNTPPQVHLSASRRAANVRGAFAVFHPRGIRGAHVLLVDDVVTTGATANEAARTLLEAGAKRVTVAVLAKAEPPTAYAHHIHQ